MTLAAGLSLPFHTMRDTASSTRDRVDILSQELASGRSADTSRALSSDFSELSHLSHRMHNLQSVRESLGQAKTWGDALQTSLETIGQAGQRVAQALPASLAAAGNDGVQQAAATARGAAEDIGAALRHTIAGRAIFANGSETPPLASVADVLDDVGLLARGAADFDSYVNAVDSYFASAGTFETTRVTGFDAAPIRFPAGEGQSVSFAVDAKSSEVRDAFKQAVLVAGLSDAGFDMRAGDRGAAMMVLQERSAQVGANLPLLQGRIGVQEARIATRYDAAETGLQDAEVAISEAVGVDPFDVATRLQDEMSRLETLYAITARQAQLRLTDYL